MRPERRILFRPHANGMPMANGGYDGSEIASERSTRSSDTPSERCHALGVRRRYAREISVKKKRDPRSALAEPVNADSCLCCLIKASASSSPPLAVSASSICFDKHIRLSTGDGDVAVIANGGDVPLSSRHRRWFPRTVCICHGISSIAVAILC